MARSMTLLSNSSLRSPLIERYKACANADEIVKAQEDIQQEIQREVAERRERQEHDDGDDMLRRNPNHSSGAWRPLRRSRKDPSQALDGDEEEDSGEDAQEAEDDHDSNGELEEDDEDAVAGDGETTQVDALGNTIIVPKPPDETRSAKAATSGDASHTSAESLETAAADLAIR